MRRSIPLFVVIMATLFAPNSAVTAATPAQPPSYHIAKVIPLGLPDRWDYVVFDPDLHESMSRTATAVTVVDGVSGAVIGTVRACQAAPMASPSRTHRQRLYRRWQGRRGCRVRPENAQGVKRIKAESDADGIVFDPASGHIFVIDGDFGKLTVIDPKTDEVVATIDGGGGLEFGDTGNNGKFYVDAPRKMKSCASTRQRTWSTPIGPCRLASNRMVLRLTGRITVFSPVARTKSWSS